MALVVTGGDALGPVHVDPAEHSNQVPDYRRTIDVPAAGIETGLDAAEAVDVEVDGTDHGGDSQRTNRRDGTGTNGSDQPGDIGDT